MPSNAEILAQLEKLAEDVALSGDDRVCIRNILAAFKRLVKIEEAAKRFYWANRLEGEAKGAQLPRDRIIDAECATMSAVSELTAALKQRVAELEREQSALTKMAREATPDYPFDPKHPLPLREAVYGLTQALEGTTLACGDLWKELEAARKVASCLHDFATAHEKWEAALIMDDAAWQGGMAALPTLTETLYDGMMELQRQRNLALAAYRATREKTNG